MKSKTFLSIIILFFSFSVSANSVNRLAERLIKLRSEVENLNSDIESKKSDLKNSLKSLALQKGNLDLDLQKEKIRKEQYLVKIEKIKDQIMQSNPSSDKIMKFLLTTISNLREIIRDGIPFKIEKRLDSLESIKSKLNSKLLTPQKGLNILWSFIEDEFRLTRENGIYRQTVVIDGKEKLAGVAKIGMMMMFFKTHDDQVGRILKEKDRWEYILESDKNNIKKITGLFDSLKKQIRVGFFEIPNGISLN